MKHTRLAYWIATMLLTAAGAAAQTARPPDNQDQPASGGRTVTLRGCLTSWGGTPAGVSREEGDASAVQRYVLTGVEHGAGIVPPTATGTSGAGAPTTATPRAARDSYVLQAKSTLMLSHYLNRQVEVNGTLDVVPPHDASTDDPLARLRPKAAGEPLSTAPPPPGASIIPERTKASPVQLQRVTVTSARMIAAKCEP